MIIRAPVYQGRDNGIVLALTLDGLPYDLDAHSVQAVSVLIAGVEYDSNSPGVSFSGDRVTLQLGIVASDLPLGVHDAKLIVYTGANPDQGVVWVDPLRFEVRL